MTTNDSLLTRLAELDTASTPFGVDSALKEFDLVEGVVNELLELVLRGDAAVH